MFYFFGLLLPSLHLLVKPTDHGNLSLDNLITPTVWESSQLKDHPFAQTHTKPKPSQVQGCSLCISLTSSIFATEIREAPDVAQTDSIAHTGQQEVKFPLPGTSVWDLLLLLLLGAHDLRADGLWLLQGCLLHLRGRAQLHGGVVHLAHGGSEVNPLLLRGWRSRKGSFCPGHKKTRWEALCKAPGEKGEKEGIPCQCNVSDLVVPIREQIPQLSSYLLLIPVLCRKSFGTSRHAAKPQVVGDPPHSTEIHLSCLSDRGGHDEGARAPRSGVQNRVQQSQSHLRVCVAQPAKHCYGCAPLGNPMHLSLTTAATQPVHSCAPAASGKAITACSAPPCAPCCMWFCNPQVYPA